MLWAPLDEEALTINTSDPETADPKMLEGCYSDRNYSLIADVTLPVHSVERLYQSVCVRACVHRA